MHVHIYIYIRVCVCVYVRAQSIKPTRNVFDVLLELGHSTPLGFNHVCGRVRESVRESVRV